MHKHKIKQYLLLKHIISIKLKNYYKYIILKSIIHNFSLINQARAAHHIIFLTSYFGKTRITDVCLISSRYKQSTKWSNFSRFEFHKLCRTNKLTTVSTYSW